MSFHNSVGWKGGAQAQLDCVFEVEGADKPVCVAEVLFRYYA